MFVKHLSDCREFMAGDGSVLQELLHPGKEALQIRYSLAHARVGPGRRTRPHKLRSSEVYYVLAGKGDMHINQETLALGPGCAVYIPPRSMQHIENTGDSDLAFLCIVDPAWQQEDEEVF